MAKQISPNENSNFQFYRDLNKKSPNPHLINEDFSNTCNGIYSSPSWPMASTGQLSKASMQSSTSLSVEGCFFTKDASESLTLPKISGAISRQSPQAMH